MKKIPSRTASSMARPRSAIPRISGAKLKSAVAGVRAKSQQMKGIAGAMPVKSRIKGMPGKSLKGRRPMLGGKKGTR